MLPIDCLARLHLVVKYARRCNKGCLQGVVWRIVAITTPLFPFHEGGCGCDSSDLSAPAHSLQMGQIYFFLQSIQTTAY